MSQNIATDRKVFNLLKRLGLRLVMALTDGTLEIGVAYNESSREKVFLSPIARKFESHGNFIRGRMKPLKFWPHELLSFTDLDKLRDSKDFQDWNIVELTKEAAERLDLWATNEDSLVKLLKRNNASLLIRRDRSPDTPHDSDIYLGLGIGGVTGKKVAVVNRSGIGSHTTGSTLMIEEIRLYHFLKLSVPEYDARWFEFNLFFKVTEKGIDKLHSGNGNSPATG